MKKIYTAMLMAAMSMGSTASDFLPVTPAISVVPSSELMIPSDVVRLSNPNLSKLTRKNVNPINSTRTEAIAEDLLGEYSVTYVDPLHEIMDASGQKSAVTLNSVGEITIEEGFGPDDYTMTFPFLIYSGNDADVYGMQFPIYVEGNKISIHTESYATEGGTLELQVYQTVFNGKDYDAVLVDKMETEFTGSGFSFDKNYIFTVRNVEEKGNYFLAYYSTFQKSNAENFGRPEDSFNVGWKSLGMGVYQDGWLMSNAARGEQNLWCYEVEIQQSEIDENVYRILNPYGPNTPMAAQNESVNFYGSIQFNMQDEDHVYFQAVPTNFSSKQADISQFFATNQLTLPVEGLGWDVESAVAMMEQGGYDLWTTFKDGILVVPSRLREDGGYDNDALFSTPEMGLGVAPYYGRNWQGDNKLPLNMQAILFFPGVYEAGVEGVEIDSNAPVKYYNLQGVEVANPEKGQLLIKRQGGKAEKIVF